MWFAELTTPRNIEGGHASFFSKDIMTQLGLGYSFVVEHCPIYMKSWGLTPEAQEAKKSKHCVQLSIYPFRQEFAR